MARFIISLIPRHRREEAKKARLNQLVSAAWKFAHCALWPERKITHSDELMVVDYITEYFTAAIDQKRAFKALIQRVLLTRNYVQSAQDRYVPEPVVWFNRRYPFGFAGTLAWLHKVEQERKEVPGYLGHLEAFAQCFYACALRPSEHHIGKCREVILQYQAESLLHLFYSAIVHLHYLRA